jgi:hypothetical protein
VRKAIGANYIGSRSLTPNLGLVFQTHDLDNILVERPAVQYWLLNDETPGLMGPIDLHGTWWLIAFGVDKAKGPVNTDAIIAGAAGKRLNATVLSTDPWTARMELVDRSRDRRVFLLGDAAHLNPPFGGHGLNTGIGDAVPRVENRGPVAGLGRRWVARLLRVRTAAAARTGHRGGRSNNAALSSDLIRAAADAPAATAETARLQISQTIHEMKAAEYFSLDLGLGHQYTNSPVISDQETGKPAAEQDTWATKVRSGGRLPHVWLKPGFSTLHCVGTMFTLLGLGSADTSPFEEAADQVGVPLSTVDLRQYGLGAELGAELVLVRPDHLVAWHGASAPADTSALLRHVAGL